MERPIIRCLVAYPMTEEEVSAPAVVSLTLAAELKARGYHVVGPDPADEQELADWERDHPWFVRLGLT